MAERDSSFRIDRRRIDVPDRRRTHRGGRRSTDRGTSGYHLGLVVPCSYCIDGMATMDGIAAQRGSYIRHYVCQRCGTQQSRSFTA
jgi:hypothetical protein